MENNDMMIDILEAGTISLPVVLLNTYKKLGLSDTEFICLIQIYGRRDNKPSLEELSSYMNISIDECSSILRELKKKRIINNVNGRYSFKPLWNRLTSVVTKEEKQRETRTNNVDSNIHSIIEREFGRLLSPMECETITMWIEQESYSVEIIKRALMEAITSGKRNIRYIDRILVNWKNNGITTIDAARDYSQNFNKHKTTVISDQNSPNAQSHPELYPNWLEN